jgi:hypothetical protein
MPGAPSFEESALALGRDLGADGHAILSSMLLEVVPVTGAVRNGELRELIAERLRRVADATDVAPQLRRSAARLAETATDAIRLRGRAGTVWIAWDDGDNGPGGPPATQPGYSVSWQSEREGDDWWEDGPAFSELGDALAWARERTDSVIVRPSWDHGTYHWAGSGPDPRNLPPLEQPGG